MKYSWRCSLGPFSSARCPCRSTRQLQVCRVFWSRKPDSWDAQCEAEEQLRRQQAQQLEADRQSAEETAWRQQVDIVHQQLLDQQKHRAALRSRLQQDAQRAKQEQLRRIAPVAKARARARGLASLGLDPQILALSEKFGKMSDLVDEVQQQVEAQYGLMQQQDGSYGPSSGGVAGGTAVIGLQHGGMQQPDQMQQPPLQQLQQQRLQQLQHRPEQLGSPQAQALGPAALHRAPTQQVYEQRRAAAAAGSIDERPDQPAASLARARRQQQQQRRQQQLFQQPSAVPTQPPLSRQLSDAAATASSRPAGRGGPAAAPWPSSSSMAQQQLHGPAAAETTQQMAGIRQRQQQLHGSWRQQQQQLPPYGAPWQPDGQLQQVWRETQIRPEGVQSGSKQQVNLLQQPAMTQEATTPVQQQTRQQRQPMAMPPNAVQQ